MLSISANWKSGYKATLSGLSFRCTMSVLVRSTPSYASLKPTTYYSIVSVTIL